MLGIRKVITSIAFALVGFSGAVAHECDAILSQGVRNTYKVLQTDNFDRQFRTKFCQDIKKSKNSGGSQALSAGYAGYSLSYGGSSSNGYNDAQQFCDEKNDSTVTSGMLNALQMVADPAIVQAWRGCMSTTFGLLLNALTIEDKLVIEYRFRASGSVSSTKIKSPPDILGATCNQALPENTVIDSGGLSQVCTRTGKNSVIIVVNTEFETKSLTIPALIEQKENPENKNNTNSSLIISCASARIGVPVNQECVSEFGNRYHPTLGLADENKIWCTVDPRYIKQQGYGYCISADNVDPCICEKSTNPHAPQAGATGKRFDVKSFIDNSNRLSVISTPNGGVGNIPSK